MKTSEKSLKSGQSAATDDRFTTVSGRKIRKLYVPEDLPSGHYDKEIGLPGAFPYTRGIHADMYRGKKWTMRQFSGFGSAEETNSRFKFLLEQGQTGLSVAFDLPTLMGVDSDSAVAEGEVGKCGVAIDSLADMEVLFDGIRLDEASTSMTINAPAAVLLAMYLAVADRQRASFRQIRGTLQNDILKEYIAQKEWIYPAEPSMRLIVDSIEFCTEHVPNYNAISISGYHIREAGSTAAQELAFTLRDGIEYVEWCLRRGLALDDFAPRLSFFFNSHNDFFEEIAKFRAARRVWAKVMRERFQSRQERSWQCRFHTQTAGCSLTAQQPFNNVIRTAIQALAGVLGGTNSLHTNSMDEALALPTEQSARIALRTQQILAHESGVANTVDPLGGSYFLESLTNELEEDAFRYFEEIDSMGGMIAAIERGYPQKEIQEASYQYQRAMEAGEKKVVGVNSFLVDEEPPVEILRIGEEVRERQSAKLKKLRRSRSEREVRNALDQLTTSARSDENLMPAIIDAVKSYATLGEICLTLQDVFGVYEEPVF
ncbi:MAG TPA: methylmalonyl-CoA mutase family protein [Acidobacteriota bacterium]|nr:methylmalonyl-CoA mutase family protein [Acidobacteriota bacterium]